jgi:tyrosyl-tRNA synthetase
LLQSYDFCHLFETEKCVMQIGGSDQWGNITNGTELIKKKFNREAYAITMPLLLTKAGAKFGKS